MTDKKLSQLDASSTVDFLYGELSGTSKKFAPANILGGPFPFFGTGGTSAPWSRPAAAVFSTIFNQNIPGATSPNPATITDNPNRLPLVLTGGFLNNDYATFALFKTAPTPPWTITVAMAGFTTYTTSYNLVILSPILLRDSGTGKVLGITWTISNASQRGHVTTWDNLDVSTAPT